MRRRDTRPRAATLLLAACAIAGGGEPVSAAAGPGEEGASVPFRIDRPSTIPFESPSGLVIMTGRINGRSHVRLLLDTGDPSGFTLDTKTARAIGLPLSERTPTRATGVVGSERYTLYRAQVQSFLLGGLSARDLTIWTAPDAVLIARTIGIHVDGFVGVDLLRGLIVTIDYPTRQITFGLPAAKDPRGIPMRLDGNRIVLEVTLNGSESRSMILDTAAETTFISESDLPLTRPSPAGRTTQIVDSSGGAVSVPVRILPKLRIGDVVDEQVPVVPYDFESLGRGLFAGMPALVSGIIGSDVLSRHVVVLDFPNRTAAILAGGR